MQTIKSSLETLKNFIEEKITEYNIELPALQKKEMEQFEEPELVVPPVVLGTLPHTNFTTYGMNENYFNAPYILLGIEECSFDEDQDIVPILIQVCCYASGGYQSTRDEDMEGYYVPDNLAVLDVLSILERIRDWLIDESPVATHRPMRIGTYSNKENTYPLAFGYIAFDIVTYDSRSAKIDFNNL